MYAQLILRSGKHAGRTLSMRHRKVLLGSGEDCSLKIPSRDVAARHCTIFVSGGRLVVHQLAKHGKTLVDEEPLHGTRQLQPGDVLQIGPVTLEVQFDPEELAKTAPVPDPEDAAPRGQAPSDTATPVHVVGVASSREWNACPSPSDAAAGVLRQLYHHE